MTTCVLKGESDTHIGRYKVISGETRKRTQVEKRKRQQELNIKIFKMPTKWDKPRQETEERPERYRQGKATVDQERELRKIMALLPTQFRKPHLWALGSSPGKDSTGGPRSCHGRNRKHANRDSSEQKQTSSPHPTLRTATVEAAENHAVPS